MPNPKKQGRKDNDAWKQVEIHATPAEVWKALSDPAELTNWFPLEARVTPGARGKLFVSWGPECEGEAEIVAWAKPAAGVERELCDGWKLFWKHAGRKRSLRWCRADSLPMKTGK